MLVLESGIIGNIRFWDYRLLTSSLIVNYFGKIEVFFSLFVVYLSIPATQYPLFCKITQPFPQPTHRNVSLPSLSENPKEKGVPMQLIHY